MLLLESKYVKNQHEYQGDALVEAAQTWLVINKHYVSSIKGVDSDKLTPIAEELDNLEAIFRVIIKHHENPRRPC